MKLEQWKWEDERISPKLFDRVPGKHEANEGQVSSRNSPLTLQNAPHAFLQSPAPAPSSPLREEDGPGAATLQTCPQASRTDRTDVSWDAFQGRWTNKESSKGIKYSTKTKAKFKTSVFSHPSAHSGRAPDEIYVQRYSVHKCGQWVNFKRRSSLYSLMLRKLLSAVPKKKKFGAAQRENYRFLGHSRHLCV